jgi:hypothetical protein
MDYEPKNDNLDAPKNPGAGLPKGTIKHIERCLMNGKTVDETSDLCSVGEGVVSNFRKKLIAEGKLDQAAWKKSMQIILGEASMVAAERLRQNIDQIPIGQLAVAMAIMTDKTQNLSDAPQTVVIPARLQISQDDINKALQAFENRNVIDITPEKNTEKNP